jgi:hypothetical protein
MAAPLDLSDVTICAADSAFVPLTVRALKLSMAQCTFGDAILFSHLAVDGPFRTVDIAPLASIEDYSRFCLRGLAEHIRTPYALVIQWDGYVVNAAAWSNAFRKYDYIGAAWHGLFPGNPRLVGNGGFSLRSRRLLQATARLPPVGGFWEDRVICHIFGEQLERTAGIRFAPAKVADRFSYEFRVPDEIPFGFHGPAHLWRHSDDAELAAALALIDLRMVDINKMLVLLHNCVEGGRTLAATTFYDRLRRIQPPLVMQRLLTPAIGGEAAAGWIASFEALVRA